MGGKKNVNSNSYSLLSAAEFKGRMGEKVEHIEAEILELKKVNGSNAVLLQGLTTNLAVLMSTGSIQAQKACEDIKTLHEKVVTIEEREKDRRMHSNRLAAIFGAIGGAILSFITHFITTWLAKPK